MDRPAPDMTITFEETGSRGRYEAHVPGKPTAEPTFSRAGERLVIADHTGVPDALRGMGVGVALVKRLVEDMRASGTRVVPLCPFVKAQMARHPEWRDVLAD